MGDKCFIPIEKIFYYRKENVLLMGQKIFYQKEKEKMFDLIRKKILC